MPKIDAAESLLSLATTPDRAANIAGDLSEEAVGHSAVWFWFSLTRIASSLVWKAWSDQPWRMLGLGLGAFILSSGTLVTLVMGLAVMTTRQGVFPTLASTWTVMVSQALTGRWLARRAGRRVLAACVSFFVIDTIVVTSSSIVLLLTTSRFEVAEIVMEMFMNTASYAFVFVGIGQVQSRSQ